MDMGFYELENELISELRAKNNKIDGDLERISSSLGEQMILSFYGETQGQLAKAKNIGSDW